MTNQWRKGNAEQKGRRDKAEGQGRSKKQAPSPCPLPPDDEFGTGLKEERGKHHQDAYGVKAEG
jgi:hypothetical protein